MYKIKKNEGYLQVDFEGDFDINTVQAIIHRETSMKEYSHTNDLWMIGKHRGHIRLGEIETMVREFHCHCPRNATRSKTAVVVEGGLTHGVIELWVKGLRKLVSFEIRVFKGQEEAQSWLGISMEKVA